MLPTPDLCPYADRINGAPSNGLGLSGGAPLDREGCRADSWFQNRRDLVGAMRRPLQALVGRQLA